MDDMDRVEVKQPPSIKEKLSQGLIDKLNPEMITFFYDSEIEVISALEIVVKDENETRKKRKSPPNIYSDFLKLLKVHRTSRNGWRAIQMESVIKSNIESEEKNNGFGAGLRNMFKGG